MIVFLAEQSFLKLQITSNMLIK